MEKVLVKNAADHSQVKEAAKREKITRTDELNDLISVLNTPFGRRVIWRILERCKTFGSVWEPSAKIHYNAGQQDVGHYLMAEIVEADESLLLKMMSENKKERI